MSEHRGGGAPARSSGPEPRSGDGGAPGRPAGPESSTGTGAAGEALHALGDVPAEDLRRVARVILLDPQDRILLIHGYEPDDPSDTWWFTPGGGVEDGESREEAARREVAEETGITEVELGPVIWRRVCSFPFDGRRWDQDEWYYLARTTQTATSLTGLTGLERRSVAGLRWWTSAELSAARETVYPTRLAELLRTLLVEGPPSVPVVLAPEIA